MSFMKKYWPECALIILTLGGLASVFAGRDDVIQLTPVYLLLNMALLIYRFGSNKTLWSMIAVAGFIGYVTEFFGLQTGILFGDYTYGDVLGLKIFDTPLMVGVMWALVMIVIWSLLPRVWGWRRVPLAGVIAVIYDIILEHFATRFDLWTWDGSIPLSNALGWFLVASLIAGIFHWRDYNLPSTLLSQMTLPLHTLFFLSALWNMINI